ncbi:MAG: hypothetical protein KKD31_19490 [Bacteroidetes bacterium]|nr:hypothetical protein [Bacteroidota bacterium]
MKFLAIVFIVLLICINAFPQNQRSVTLCEKEKIFNYSKYISKKNKKGDNNKNHENVNSSNDLNRDSIVLTFNAGDWVRVDIELIRPKKSGLDFKLFDPDGIEIRSKLSIKWNYSPNYFEIIKKGKYTFLFQSNCYCRFTYKIVSREKPVSNIGKVPR